MKFITENSKMLLNNLKQNVVTKVSNAVQAISRNTDLRLSDATLCIYLYIYIIAVR